MRSRSRPRHVRLPAYLIAALLGAGLAGCGKQGAAGDSAAGASPAASSGTGAGSSGASSAGTAASGAGSAVAAAGTVVEDTTITAKLKAALLADTTLKGASISVETRNGEVVLTGAVNNAAQRQHAAQIAQALNGVKNVNNKLAMKQ